MVHLTEIRRASSFAKVVRGLQFPEICHLLLHPRLWLQELGELLRPVALTLIYLSPLFFFTGCAALVVADLAAKGIVYANEKQSQQQGTSGISSSNDYVFCPNTNSYKYGADGNCAQPEEVVQVVLPTVSEPTGLFKGFTADEDGTNLDDPNPNKVVSKKPFKDCPECPEMVVVPAGGFTMGSGPKEQAFVKSGGTPPEFTAWENPQHHVHVRSFAAGRYAVTKGEFASFVLKSGYKTEAERSRGCAIKETEAITDNWRNVGFPQGDDHPVVCVTWNDAQAYIQWLNRASGKSYRLLGEAEREYAARGGTQTAFWWGDDITTSQANYNGARYGSSPSGQVRMATVTSNSFSPNPFGLFNVHGNVWEWTQDCWHETYAGAPADGRSWATACTENRRVIRGGSWNMIPSMTRSASRLKINPDAAVNFIGFRLARDL